MNSTKCPQCGFVYWSDVPNCKRCGLANPAMGPEAPDSSAYSTGNAEDSTSDPHAQENATLAHNPSAAPIFWGNDPVKEGLLKTITGNACFFYVLGALQALLWFVVGNLLIVDAFLNIGLALIVHKFKSRAAAILLICVTGISVLGAVAYAFTNGFGLLMLAPITLIFRVIASIKLVSATFELHAHEAEMQPMPPSPPVFNQNASPQW
jgi:hypothetical protein